MSIRSSIKSSSTLQNPSIISNVDNTPDFMVLYNKGLFKYKNGDTYDGNFVANLRRKTIYRHGYGVYKSANGTVFDGTWNEDQFTNDEKNRILYPDGSYFEGELTNFPEYKRGKYTFPDNSTLECEFSDNKPKKNLIFTSPNGYTKWDQSFQNNVLTLRAPNAFNPPQTMESFSGENMAG